MPVVVIRLPFWRDILINRFPAYFREGPRYKFKIPIDSIGIPDGRALRTTRATPDEASGATQAGRRAFLRHEKSRPRSCTLCTKSEAENCNHLNLRSLEPESGVQINICMSLIQSNIDPPLNRFNSLVAGLYLARTQGLIGATNSVLAVCLPPRELFLCARHPFVKGWGYRAFLRVRLVHFRGELPQQAHERRRCHRQRTIPPIR
jgi:hypothetical protein